MFWAVWVHQFLEVPKKHNDYRSACEHGDSVKQKNDTTEKQKNDTTVKALDKWPIGHYNTRYPSGHWVHSEDVMENTKEKILDAALVSFA